MMSACWSRGLSLVVVLAVASTVPGEGQQESPAAEAVEDVSLVALISNPGHYDGKLVRVVGFLNTEFEGDGLYLHHDYHRLGISKNAVWVSVEEDRWGELSELSGKYVLLEGRFSTMKGHMDLFSGELGGLRRWDFYSEVKGGYEAKGRVEKLK